MGTVDQRAKAVVWAGLRRMIRTGLPGWRNDGPGGHRYRWIPGRWRS